MIRFRTKRSIAALSILTALTWLGAKDHSEPKGKPFDDLDTKLNYALWDFSAILLNHQGKLNLYIEAPILRNNADSQVGTMENPRFRIQQQELEWYISADSAIITADRQHVSLIGKVAIQRQGNLPQDKLEIHTRDVMLNVAPQTATTDAAVAMTQNGDHLDANGMKLNMKNDRYELMEKVRVQYATP